MVTSFPGFLRHDLIRPKVLLAGLDHLANLEGRRSSSKQVRSEWGKFVRATYMYLRFSKLKNEINPVDLIDSLKCIIVTLNLHFYTT